MGHMRTRDIMLEVRTLLQDNTSVRWPLTELLVWINAGMRDIVLNKPTAHTETIVLSLDAGSRQRIPGDAIQLIRIVRNVRGAGLVQGGSAITPVSREIMDSQVPDWSNAWAHAPQKEVLHVITDPEDQQTYYVWPPNDGSGHVEAIVSTYPATAPAGNPADKLQGYPAPLDLKNIYWNALVNYVCFRCYSKDAQFADNAQRAANYRALYLSDLGVKATSEANANPNTTNLGTAVVTPARGG